MDVSRPDGCLLQSLPYAGDEPDDDNRDYFAFVEDMDFDGFPDLGVLFSQGMQNIYYDCWLWREEAGCFVKYEGMRDAASPRFDRERKRVLSFEHISASDSVETEYAWENGRLIPMKRITREISSDEGNLVIRLFARGDDGELRLSKEKTHSLDELDSCEAWGVESDYQLLEERPSRETVQLRDGEGIREIPLVNNLGFGLAAVYAHAPGHEPWKVAGPLPDGETARVDASTLRASRRLIVEKAENGNAEAPDLQFFNDSYLEDVERMELAFREFRNVEERIPALLTVENGRKNAAIAGLPFDILLSFLESEKELDAGRYAELMFPLAADGWESYEFALASGSASWRLLPPGPVFRRGGDGRNYLSDVAFAADLTRQALFGFLDEFYGARVMPRTIRLGDGTTYAFGGEAKEYPDAIPAGGTGGADGGSPWEILKERLGGWIDRHCPPEQPDMRLFLESPEARYELWFNSGTDAAEFRFQRRIAGVADRDTDHAAVAAEGEAAGAAIPFVLKIGATSVDVYRPDGSLLQALPCGGDEPDDDNRDFFAFVEDMDFDGFPDVGVLFSQGQKILYDAWRWRPEAGAFVRYEGMRDIPSPRFDPESKRVTSFELAGRGEAKTIFAWENGELVPLEQTVQYLDDDGGKIVISRYARGADGELRLVGEERRRVEEMGDCEDDVLDDASYRPDLPGLNLFLNPPADPLDVAVLPNGEWWLWRADEDRTLFIESRRLPALDYEKEAAERLVRTGWPMAREIAVAPFSALAEKITYPAFKAEFLVGENEDTRQFVAALVFTEEWSFWFVLYASADELLGPPDAGADADAVVGNERLRKYMEKLLLDIDAVDPAGGDFLPSFGIPVYMTGADSTLRISVMDALIRIKKVAGPEDSPWLGEGGIAYRYDGPGSAAGKPALLFSFGADSREKFTAERRYAVDDAGLVYEMDVLAGGEYWQLEDAPPSWWGEYTAGEKALYIGNYREGPYGMYFICSFSVGGIEQADLTVPARGRTASGYGLVFQLAGDDSEVTVSLDEDWGEMDLGEAAKMLVGNYVRAESAGPELTYEGYYTLKSDAFDGYLTVEQTGGENFYAVHIFAIQKGGANNSGEVDGGGKLVGNKILVEYGGGIPDPDATVEVIFDGETAKVATSEAFKGSGWLGAGVVLDGEYAREKK
ncbi:MAG: hypothetical protein LBT97_03840 [Planctomycetota bacterium]|nr:hypothetical protein [Planctomycetota bacterium]